MNRQEWMRTEIATWRQEGDIDEAPAQDEQQAAPQFAEPGANTDPAADDLAELAQDLAPAGNAIVGEWMRRIEQLLDEATSVEDLLERILSAFDALPEDDLVGVMQLGLMAARMTGMDAVRREAQA